MKNINENSNYNYLRNKFFDNINTKRTFESRPKKDLKCILRIKPDIDVIN